MKSNRSSPHAPASNAEIVWSYQYPAIRGEVVNNAVTRFQTGIVNLAEASEMNSVEDFTRNYYINRKNYPANSQPSTVLAGIYKFVDSATGYGRDKSDKDKLKKYLATRGGQNHNYLIQELVKANHFFNSFVHGESSVSQDCIDANWSINADGKIELIYCVDLQSLEFKRQDSLSVFTIIADGENKLACYDPTSIEFAERKQSQLAPLMRVTARMRLEIRNGIVLPVVTQLNVDGFSNRIPIHQENFVNNNDERNFHVVKLLTMINASIKEFSRDNWIKYKLLQIKRLVEQSNYGEDMTAIKLACQYIERTTCYFYKHFYNLSTDERTMIDVFKEDSGISKKFEELFGIKIQRAATKEDINHQLRAYGITPSEAINEETYDRSSITERFAGIYLHLQTFFHHYQPASSYTYPVSSSGIIDAEFFNKWQQLPANSLASDEIIYKDFRSRCQIQHHCLSENSDDNEINDAIRDLVNDAKSLSKDESTVMLDWIKSHRHKACDQLANKLVAHHEIKIKAGNSQGLTSGNLRHTINIHRESAEWEIDIEGNVSISCVYYISSIQSQRLNTFGFKNPQTNHLSFNSDGLNSADDKPPIVRIEIRISLPVREGRVTPTLKLLKIDSYTYDVTLARLEQGLAPRSKPNM